MFIHVVNNRITYIKVFNNIECLFVILRKQSSDILLEYNVDSYIGVPLELQSLIKKRSLIVNIDSLDIKLLNRITIYYKLYNKIEGLI